MATLGRESVSTMADVRVHAELLVWTTRDAYRNAARHAPGLSRDDRAAMHLKAREYKRRAVRVSQYLNRFP